MKKIIILIIIVAGFAAAYENVDQFKTYVDSIISKVTDRSSSSKRRKTRGSSVNAFSAKGTLNTSCDGKHWIVQLDKAHKIDGHDMSSFIVQMPPTLITKATQFKRKHATLRIEVVTKHRLMSEESFYRLKDVN